MNSLDSLDKATEGKKLIRNKLTLKNNITYINECCWINYCPNFRQPALTCQSRITHLVDAAGMLQKEYITIQNSQFIHNNFLNNFLPAKIYIL